MSVKYTENMNSPLIDCELACDDAFLLVATNVSEERTATIFWVVVPPKRS
jgi:hypothetical protein